MSTSLWVLQPRVQQISSRLPPSPLRQLHRSKCERAGEWRELPQGRILWQESSAFALDGLVGSPAARALVESDLSSIEALEVTICLVTNCSFSATLFATFYQVEIEFSFLL